ncbi:hypothetical protein E2C01_086367 [Portunus trituberculatus]|uniref:Uncharacterized protein n=1 Tax=Portunus trituberculatus TaxID=210409 RepID=A0A5B7J937_PORTR|nr:hypothetical protein [Portunus trituberculatus]
MPWWSLACCFTLRHQEEKKMEEESLISMRPLCPDNTVQSVPDTGIGEVLRAYKLSLKSGRLAHT